MNNYIAKRWEVAEAVWVFSPPDMITPNVEDS